MGKQLKAHRFAELLPMMTEMEWSALMEDIRLNGQQEPIVLYQGQILDGRNRWRAIMKLNGQPQFTRFKGSEAEALAFVKSKLMHRNLTDSQKAAVAVQYLPTFEKLAISRQKRNGKEPVPSSPNGQARDHLGEFFGVSGRYISDARFIFESDPKLFKEVFDGRLPITRAKRLMIRKKRTAEIKRKALVPVPSDFEFIQGPAGFELQKMNRGKFRLVFWDPPYNLKFKYDGDPTHDDLPRSEYYHMIERVLAEIFELLTADGTLCLMISEEHVHRFGVMLEERGFTLRRLIVWHESFGQMGTRNFGRTCRFIWYATKHPSNFVFDESALLTPAKRSLIYKDKRAMPGGKVLDALWDFSRVAGTFSERIPDEGIPTQLPIELLKRIVAGFTDPGDWVLDPMCGTGTTARACLALGRKCVSIDRSKKYIAIAKRELGTMPAVEGKRHA
jgi:DNA modification methylase